MAISGDAGVARWAVWAKNALQRLWRALYEAGEEEVGRRLLPQLPQVLALFSVQHVMGEPQTDMLHSSKQEIQLRGVLLQAAKNTHLVICVCVAPGCMGCFAAACAASFSSKAFCVSVFSHCHI